MSTRLFLLFVTHEVGKSSKREARRSPKLRSGRRPAVPRQPRAAHNPRLSPPSPSPVPSQPPPPARTTSPNTATGREISNSFSAKSGTTAPQLLQGPDNPFWGVGFGLLGFFLPGGGYGWDCGQGRLWLAAPRRAAAPVSAPRTAPPSAARRGGGGGGRSPVPAPRSPVPRSPVPRRNERPRRCAQGLGLVVVVGCPQRPAASAPG